MSKLSTGAQSKRKVNIVVIEKRNIKTVGKLDMGAIVLDNFK